tara:strand:+ start:1579 stop:2058 length:480 start_codon:yes stop_codon:yes gene_type:complete
MADLTVTITESATSLEGSESTSDTVTTTISGIVSIYHYKGKANGDGSTHPIYTNNSTYNTGTGGDALELAYLRITNLEDDGTACRLTVTDSADESLFLNLKENESFILFPKTGTTGQIDNESSNDPITVSSNLKSIAWYTSAFEDKYFEIYAVFIEGGV